MIAFSIIHLFFLPEPFYKLLTFLTYVVLISAGMVVWCLFVFFLWFLLQKKQQVNLCLEVENRGNIDTSMQMRVELGDLAKKVKVLWWVNNQRQQYKNIEQISFKEELITVSVKPVTSQAEQRSQEQKEEQKKKVKQPGVKEEAARKFGLVKSMAQALASISSALAAILPKPLKGPFRDFANRIQKTQSNASQILSEPDRLATSGRQMQANVKRLKNPSGISQTTKSSSAQSKSGNLQETRQIVSPVEMKVRQRVTQTIQVIETRLLNPAEKIIYRVVIRPKNPFSRLEGHYQIISQPLEYVDYPSYNEIQPQILRGVLHVKSLSVVQVVLFIFLCVFVLTVNFVLALMAAGWMRGFFPS